MVKPSRSPTPNSVIVSPPISIVADQPENGVGAPRTSDVIVTAASADALQPDQLDAGEIEHIGMDRADDAEIAEAAGQVDFHTGDPGDADLGSVIARPDGIDAGAAVEGIETNAAGNEENIIAGVSEREVVAQAGDDRVVAIIAIACI